MTARTLAIIVVIALFGLFVLLLLASLVRARFAASALEGAAEGKPFPEAEEEKKAPKPVSRREFVRRSLLTSLSLFGAEFGLASLAFLWPNLLGGFGSLVNVGLSSEDIKAQIDADQEPFYFGAGRFYLVKYDDPVPEIYQPFVAEGLMALYQRCVHLGCRVPFCKQSQWFECPCHGSKYNTAGEWRDGPAPRGLDRFPVSVQDGVVSVDTSVA
ncbi:MAG TPA: Rieske 2Fe-2S domain-containing protein, partial [Actinomycetota bacterium]|nr:Rieske 2Fe-2S domain-containing protein [Actinomycetota bacterium]